MNNQGGYGVYPQHQSYGGGVPQGQYYDNYGQQSNAAAYGQSHYPEYAPTTGGGGPSDGYNNHPQQMGQNMQQQYFQQNDPQQMMNTSLNGPAEVIPRDPRRQQFLQQTGGGGGGGFQQQQSQASFMSQGQSQGESEKILRNPNPHIPLGRSVTEAYDPSLPTYNATPIYPGHHQQQQQVMSGPKLVAPTISSIFQAAAEKLSQKQMISSGRVLEPVPAPLAHQPTLTASSPIKSSSSNIPPLTLEIITGIVTQMQEMFGMVSGEVFFQTSVVVGAMPQVGDKVVVEAEKVEGMPFKFNGIRVQMLSKDLLADKEKDKSKKEKKKDRDSEKSRRERNDNKKHSSRDEQQLPFGPLPRMPTSLNLTKPIPSPNGNGSTPLKSILKRNPPPPPVISKSKAYSSSSSSGMDKYRPESPTRVFSSSVTNYAHATSIHDEKNGYEDRYRQHFKTGSFSLDLRNDFPIIKPPTTLEQLYPELLYVNNNMGGGEQRRASPDFTRSRPQQTTKTDRSGTRKKSPSPLRKTIRRDTRRSRTPTWEKRRSRTPTREKRRSRTPIREKRRSPSPVRRRRSPSPVRRSPRRRHDSPPIRRNSSSSPVRRSPKRRNDSPIRRRSSPKKNSSPPPQVTQRRTSRRSKSRDRNRRSPSLSLLTGPQQQQSSYDWNSQQVSPEIIVLDDNDMSRMNHYVGSRASGDPKGIVVSHGSSNLFPRVNVTDTSMSNSNKTQNQGRPPIAPIKFAIGNNGPPPPPNSKLLPNPAYNPKRVGPASEILASVEKALKKSKKKKKDETQEPAFKVLVPNKNQQNIQAQQPPPPLTLTEQQKLQMWEEERLLLKQNQALNDILIKGKSEHKNPRHLQELKKNVEEKLKGLRDLFDSGQQKRVPTSSTTRNSFNDESSGQTPEEIERFREEIANAKFEEEERRLKSIGDRVSLERLWKAEDKRRRHREEERLEKIRLQEIKLKKDKLWTELKKLREETGGTAEREMELLRLRELRKKEEMVEEEESNQIRAEEERQKWIQEEEEVRGRDLERLQRGSEGPVRRLVMDTQIKQLQAAEIEIRPNSRTERALHSNIELPSISNRRRRDSSRDRRRSKSRSRSKGRDRDSEKRRKRSSSPRRRSERDNPRSNNRRSLSRSPRGSSRERNRSPHSRNRRRDEVESENEFEHQARRAQEMQMMMDHRDRDMEEQQRILILSQMEAVQRQEEELRRKERELYERMQMAERVYYQEPAPVNDYHYYESMEDDRRYTSDRYC